MGNKAWSSDEGLWIDTTLPNFYEWSHNIKQTKIHNGLLGYVSVYDPKDVEEALKSAFEQGLALGKLGERS